MAQSVLNGDLLRVAQQTPVIPVLTIDRLSDAVPLARALISGGLPLLEVTLRTKCALEAIADIRRSCRQAVVGAGTILAPDDADRAISAGAAFLVSPGITPRLIQAADSWSVPFLPGAATASEAMALRDLGYGFLKFFPAGQIGGAAALNSLAAALPQMAFCPTGGVTQDNAAEYLSLANVACVGGSWVAPKKAVAAADWDGIAQLAGEASKLASGAG